MKKKPKNQVYIPHQDKWNEHFPTPGKPNPNYYTDPGATFNKHLRTQKQIKIQTEMKALLLIALIIYTSLSIIHRSKRYNQIPSPTNKQKYIYITLQSLQIILLILIETLILRIPTH